MKRLIIGVLIWLLTLSACSYFFSQRKGNAKSATDQVAQYLFGSEQQVELKFSPGQVFKVGDIIFYTESDVVKPVGIITRVKAPDSNEMGLVYSSTAFATLYPSAPKISSKDFITYHSTPDSLAWVLEIMLPPEKRKELTKLIVETYQDNQDEIVQALQPIIQRTLEESVQIIGRDLQMALRLRSERIQAVSNRLQVELVEEDIVPLIQKEIWPVIQRESGPVIEQIGQEIWQKASVWRFGWRFLYDASPFPRQNLTRKEFDRFVRDTAMPIIESHLDDFLKIQRNVIREVSANERVQNVISESAREFINDAEVRDLFREIFDEVVVKNPRLQEAWRKNWSSNDAREALALTNQKLEPTITKIGESLFGNPSKEITPEFSWALRSRILKKDARWLTLVHDNQATQQSGQPLLSVIRGTDYKSNPFHIPARPRK